MTAEETQISKVRSKEYLLDVIKKDAHSVIDYEIIKCTKQLEQLKTK